MAQKEIVALETFFCPLPDFSSLPFAYSLTTYHRSAPEEIPSRIPNASILIVTTLCLSASTLSKAVSPKLELIVVMASGTNNINIEACKSRGIQVLNCPGANTEAVAQHAMALFFASRRKLVKLHHATLGLNGEARRDNKSPWEAEGTLMSRLLDRNDRAPLGLNEEVVGIIGFGRVGQEISRMCSALCMQVLISARKMEKVIPPGRVDFFDILQKSTVLMVCLPLNDSTANSITSADFKVMRRDAVLVNVSRGGVVSEGDLLSALKEGHIYGAATDVFSKEPAAFTNPLLARDLQESVNLTLSPHLAWLTEQTTARLQSLTLRNVQNWYMDHRR